MRDPGKVIKVIFLSIATLFSGPAIAADNYTFLKVSIDSVEIEKVARNGLGDVLLVDARVAERLYGARGGKNVKARIKMSSIPRSRSAKSIYILGDIDYYGIIDVKLWGYNVKDFCILRTSDNYSGAGEYIARLERGGRLKCPAPSRSFSY